jgi:hypothetical protein
MKLWGMWKDNIKYVARSKVAFEALYYKPEGSEFETRWGHYFFFQFT